MKSTSVSLLCLWHTPPQIGWKLFQGPQWCFESRSQNSYGSRFLLRYIPGWAIAIRHLVSRNRLSGKTWSLHRPWPGCSNQHPAYGIDKGRKKCRGHSRINACGKCYGSGTLKRRSTSCHSVKQEPLFRKEPNEFIRGGCRANSRFIPVCDPCNRRSAVTVQGRRDQIRSTLTLKCLKENQRTDYRRSRVPDN